MTRDEKIDYLKALKLRRRRNARKQLIEFIEYINEDYSTQWFHEVICYYIDKLLSREIKKLMVFVPPQHGKSEISSRMFPAYALGKNPKERIIMLSYNATKAGEFVVDASRIMKREQYAEVFPKTKIKGKDNTEIFEVNDGTGIYKGAGIDGGITGTAASIGIIDDPFKGRNDANSKTIRDRVWKCYQDDFLTRLDNNGVQLMLFTRWHEDDIAGRILNPKSEYYDAEEAAQWVVIALPALKELTPPLPCAIDVDDPRFIGEALWEAKHSRAKYELRKKINPIGFNALDQQRPSAEGGNMLKEEYFVIKKLSELPFNPLTLAPDFWIDGAFTEDTKNDPSALMACYFFQGNLYIMNSHGVRKALYEFLKYFKPWTQAQGKKAGSNVFIEPKASGKDMKSMLSKFEFGNFNAREIPNKPVSLGKYNRAENAIPFLASGKVILVEGGWNKEFITECGDFPNGTHDDQVDNLCYAVWWYFIRPEAGGVTVDN